MVFSCRVFISKKEKRHEETGFSVTFVSDSENAMTRKKQEIDAVRVFCSKSKNMLNTNIVKKQGYSCNCRKKVKKQKHEIWQKAVYFVSGNGKTACFVSGNGKTACFVSGTEKPHRNKKKNSRQEYRHLVREGGRIHFSGVE